MAAAVAYRMRQMASALDSFQILLLPFSSSLKWQLASTWAYVEDLSENQNSWYKCPRPQCVGLSTLIFWLRYAACLSGKLNQLFLSLFSLHLHCPVELSLSAVLVFWLSDRLKVAELWEKNDSLFCPLAVTVDLIVSVGNMASDTTIHTQPPLWMDIPFSKAPRWCCRFSVGCSDQNEWLTVFLKGWAPLWWSVKVGDHLHWFLSCKGVKLLGKKKVWMQAKVCTA